MQVRPAGIRGGDADDRIAGVLDLRVVDVLDGELERPWNTTAFTGSLLSPRPGTSLDSQLAGRFRRL
jgi:hypothetical protein